MGDEFKPQEAPLGLWSWKRRRAGLSPSAPGQLPGPVPARERQGFLLRALRGRGVRAQPDGGLWMGLDLISGAHVGGASGAWM